MFQLVRSYPTRRQVAGFGTWKNTCVFLENTYACSTRSRAVLFIGSTRNTFSKELMSTDHYILLNRCTNYVIDTAEVVNSYTIHQLDMLGLDEWAAWINPSHKILHHLGYRLIWISLYCSSHSCYSFYLSLALLGIVWNTARAVLDRPGPNLQYAYHSFNCWLWLQTNATSSQVRRLCI